MWKRVLLLLLPLTVVCSWDDAAPEASPQADQGRILRYNAPIVSLVFSPTGDVLASGDRLGNVHLWGLPDGRLRHAFANHARGVWSLAFSPDGSSLAVGAGDGNVMVWDARNGGRAAVLTGAEGPVVGATWLEDGRRLLAAGGQARTPRLWDVVTGESPIVFEAERRDPADTIVNVAVSSDQQLVAASYFDGEIVLWELANGRRKATLAGHRHLDFPGGANLSFSPAGDVLASASRHEEVHEEPAVRLWDLETGQLKASLTGHQRGVSALAFSPNGELLATGSADGSARLWNPRAGTEVASLEGDAGFIRALAFSPDGEVLVTASSDETARIWAVSPARLTRSLEGHRGPVNCVAVAPNGETIATGGGDGTVRLWSVR